MNPLDVHFIIVNYNTRDLLKNLLFYFEEARLPFRFKVTVVDNASSDGSDQEVQNRPAVRFLRNLANVGYARAVNQGFRAETALYACVLNSDVVLNDEALSACWDHLCQHPATVGVSPIVCWPDGRIQTFWFRFNLALLCSEYVRKTYNLWVRHQLRRARGPVRVDGFKGAFLFLRSEAFLSEGGILDEDYFFYFEDTDLAMRMKKRGWACQILPGCRIVHIGGQSGNGAKLEHFLRQKYLFLRKALEGAALRFVLLNERFRVRRKRLYYGIRARVVGDRSARVKRENYRREAQILKETFPS